MEFRDRDIADLTVLWKACPPSGVPEIWCPRNQCPWFSAFRLHSGLVRLHDSARSRSPARLARSEPYAPRTVLTRRRAIASTVSMVSFDVDGTLFRKAALHQAAGALGIREEWDAIDERLDLRGITLRERLESHYRLLQGIRLDHILREVFKVEVIKNIREAVNKLREHGIRVVLLTDLPDFLCVDLAERFGFDGHIASKVGIRMGIVEGDIEPLADKSLGLQEYCSERSIPLSGCVHVGDGVNDVPVFQIVGYSIALNAQNKEVDVSASHCMETCDLLDVYRHLQPFL